MADSPITDYGAVSDGTTDNAGAIQRAIDACTSAGGGRVIVPAGRRFVAGPFELKTNVTLHLEAGSRVEANTDTSLYTDSPFRNRGEGGMWIRAHRATNVAITGTGTLDGRGRAFMVDEEPTHYNYGIVDGVDNRPHLLTLIECDGVTIRDATFEDAAYWCIHPAGCTDVLIHGVRVNNSLKIRNCDGIDIDHCRNVRISDCWIRSADDSICIKNRRDYDHCGPCENITITGCILTSTSCALKLGSENVDTMRTIVVDSCIIRDSNRGLGIQNRDEGSIENVTFSNITVESRLFHDVWWGKAEPIYVTAFRRPAEAQNRLPAGATEGRVGPVRNIRFSNISCDGENGVYVAGSLDSRIEGIVFDNVDVTIRKTSKYPGGVYDRRPCDVDGILEAPAAGFRLSRADDVRLRDVVVRFAEPRQDYYGEAVALDDVRGLRIEGLEG